VGSISPDGSRVLEYSVSNTEPIGITVGPDSTLRFTERTGNALGRVTLDGGVSAVSLVPPGGGPTEITLGPDGALWFTEQSAEYIGRYVGP
jgi:virginiamycin B lyase